MFYGLLIVVQNHFWRKFSIDNNWKKCFLWLRFHFIWNPRKCGIIGCRCFLILQKISKIIFPQKSKMTALPGNAFLNTNFSSIIIPKYINKIGFCGLGQCNNLLTVEFLGNEMNLGCNFFIDSEKLIIASFPNA